MNRRGLLFLLMAAPFGVPAAIATARADVALTGIDINATGWTRLYPRSCASIHEAGVEAIIQLRRHAALGSAEKTWAACGFKSDEDLRAELFGSVPQPANAPPGSSRWVDWFGDLTEQDAGGRQ